MLEKDDVKKLFVVLQARYGHKWTTAYDSPEIMAIAVNEWHRELCGFRPEDLRSGLNDWAEPWPPSLPEFARACLPDGILGNSVNPEVKRRLPSYKYIPQSGYEEIQRNKEVDEIRKEVVSDLIKDVLHDIREDGIETMLLSNENVRLLS